MSKSIIRNYTFDTVAKTITLTDIATARLDKLMLITDVTTNRILYNFADSTVATASVATNVITLSALQGGENNTDKLQIIYDVELSDAAAFNDGTMAVAQSSTEYYTSTVNSTTAQLAGGATFAGAVEGIFNHQSAQISVVCDQAYTVVVTQYINSGGTKVLPSVTFTRAAGVPLNQNVVLPGNYVRVTITNNGSSATTTLQLSTTFGILPSGPVANGPQDPNDSLPTTQSNSVIVTGGLLTTPIINTNLLTGNVSDWVDVSSYRSCSLQIITGATTAGTLNFEQTNDTTNIPSGSNWYLNNYNSISTDTNFQLVLSSSATSIWSGPIVCKYIRIRASTAITGTTVHAVMNLSQQQVSFPSQSVRSSTATNFLATVTQGAAGAAAWLANPLTPAVSLTGDTGAKVATGNGATLTNTTAKGAHVIVNMGAVTGTLPTCVVKLQGSANSGTTWYDIPNATTASLVATGVYGIMVYPGLTDVAGTTTTGTTAQASSALPRTWRIVWTIGGTSPSFTFTNVQVSYLI